MARDPRADARREPPRAPLPVKLGRPILLTAGLAYRLCRNLWTGMPRASAIHLEGISESTLRFWLKRANDISRALYWTGTNTGQERQPDTLQDIEQIAYDDFLIAMGRFAEEDHDAEHQKRPPEFHRIADLPATRDGHWLAFLAGVHQAEASFQHRLLKKIHAADDWRAAAFLLERKFPRTFGAPSLNNPIDDDAPIQKQVVILPEKSDTNETWAERVARESTQRETA